MSTSSWPEAGVDAIARLRALAAALPASALTEVTIAAPFEVVWEVASDLEGELAHFAIDVRSVRLYNDEAGRSRAWVRGRSGLRAHFDVVLRPGWCVMQSRFVMLAMAAVPSPAGTRFALLGGGRLPGSRLAAPVLSLTGRPLGRKMAARFEERVERRLRPDGGG